MQLQGHYRAFNYETFRILAYYFFWKSAGSLLNDVIHNPAFLLHVFDDNLFVFTYFLVFTSNMTVRSPQCIRDRVSEGTGGHVFYNFWA